MTHTETTPGSAPEQLRELESGEVDDVFDLLGHPQRRYLLDALGTDAPVPIADLVDAIVEGERGARGPAPDAGRADEVKLKLFHSHLPKLEEADVVDCEYGAGTVAVDDPEKLVLMNRLRAVVAEHTT
ncbi:hypothetical protein HUG10_18785 (plasmid) [Halorarum halophilum]|uniref:DUF7344 domain-containing protein n=1 Tax=Halorarum halophilum TaxID=2743090 RepID=A0A7D5KI06_9EURY|nr:hypothetical protein [Halobaculum halophilum]QLG29656.1 hypothetical protein HUG10_18785 [Halobaculum halophilum]